MNRTDRVLIWDLPTRFFHWLLVAGFTLSAVFAFLFDEKNRFFHYHAIAGLVVAFMVVLRIAWGIVGTRYARFGSFAFGPGSLLDYFKGVASGGGRRYTGHNPASAHTVFLMFILILSLAVTGGIPEQGNEWAEELHEFSAYAMISVVAVHIMGVVLHTIRHRENIVASMIHGRKMAEPGEGISSSCPAVAVIFLALTGAWAWGLFANYDQATFSTRLPLLGVQVRLGETEDRDHLGRPAGSRHGEHDSYVHEDDEHDD